MTIREPVLASLGMRVAGLTVLLLLLVLTLPFGLLIAIYAHVYQAPGVLVGVASLVLWGLAAPFVFWRMSGRAQGSVGALGAFVLTAAVYFLALPMALPMAVASL